MTKYWLNTKYKYQNPLQYYFNGSPFLVSMLILWTISFVSQTVKRQDQKL